jgi:hypothetical protein
VAVKKIQLGQVWKKNGTEDTYLVTRIYIEALASYAVLRKAGAEGEPTVRIKIAHAGGAADLPGFTFTQESDTF